MHTFSAAFPGECNECGLDFMDGDEIGYVDDQICCGECCEAAE